MGWFLTGALLNYIPTDFQIHMLNTWQIPMMILAAIGLCDLIAPTVARWKLGIRSLGFGSGRRTERLLVVVFVLAVLPTNLYLWAWRFVDLARHDYPFYLYRDDVAALDWLRENTSPDAVVLSSLTIGQYVPAISDNTAFLAHWAQTVDFYDKQERVEQFFDGSVSDQARLDTVCVFGVDYVFYGPAERDLGDYDPAYSTWLTEVCSTPLVGIYQVENPECQ
jgi:hypothetical protein